MKRKYLLDASALVNIISLVLIEKLKDAPFELWITQLTPFEIGNSLWKLYIRKEAKMEECFSTMKLLKMLLDLNLLKVIHVKEFEEILEISMKRKITFYDASYVLSAKKYGFYLVTDDKGMTTAAIAEKINVLNSDEFIRKFNEYFVIES